ncbi:hypothetical protein [Streptomyces sp. NPDC006368]|uniref:hypothetical protein n=1 Tax=Streptomyces sp. NPDC006368 TaxID=3156760 RepID=UPI0033BE4ED0
MTTGTSASTTSDTTAPPAGPPLPWRLRPGVAVTPLRDGLHLRGRRGGVTLEGSAALPRLWQLLEEPLRTGRLTGPLRQAEPGTALRAAVDTLVGHLLAYDLLVAESTGPAADWLMATAEMPATVAAALAATRVEVVSGAPVGQPPPERPRTAGPPGGPGALAGATGRALSHGGVTVAYAVDSALPEGLIQLRTTDGSPGRPWAVAAGVRGGMGFVTAPGSPEQAAADALALSARLAAGALPATSTAPPPPAAVPPPRPGTGVPEPVVLPAPFVPLLAAAAAHRLLCAAGGLPDPVDEGEDHRLLPGLPAVLVASSRPLRAEYHSWLGPDRLDPDRRKAMEPARTLADALERVAALGAQHIGTVPTPTPGALRQLPVPLAACDLRDGAAPTPRAGTTPPSRPDTGRTPRLGTVLAGAPRLDLARLEAFCRVAELRLADTHSTVRFTVGANPGHAWGRALRRAATGPRAPGPAGVPLPDGSWSGHPQARHWWTTLTERLDARARMEVLRLSPDEEAYRAVVHTRADRPAPAPYSGPDLPGDRRAPGSSPGPDLGADRPAPGPGLGWAVEATPGDAAAFAALAATAAVSAAQQDITVADLCAPGGAVAPLAVAEARPAPWEDSRWTTGWLSEVADRETALQTALTRLTGLHARQTAPATPEARELAAQLRAYGFTVLAVGEDER